MNPKIDELRVAIRDAEAEGDTARAFALKGHLLNIVQRRVDENAHPLAAPGENPMVTAARRAGDHDVAAILAEHLANRAAGDPAAPPDVDQGPRGRPLPLEPAGSAAVAAAEQAGDFGEALRLKGARLQQLQNHNLADLDPRSPEVHRDFDSRTRKDD